MRTVDHIPMAIYRQTDVGRIVDREKATGVTERLQQLLRVWREELPFAVQVLAGKTGQPFGCLPMAGDAHSQGHALDAWPLVGGRLAVHEDDEEWPVAETRLEEMCHAARDMGVRCGHDATPQNSKHFEV